jgi:hypothetical protein
MVTSGTSVSQVSSRPRHQGLGAPVGFHRKDVEELVRHVIDGEAGIEAPTAAGSQAPTQLAIAYQPLCSLFE